ncbi:MAG: DEAD/DEAH box helicase, partial [Tepidimonas sp.]|uniref:DEAD/DEAH box helicase n=1 Tax=Tepidimonas sp. TaxID=2002775 RepID=UPI0040551BAC
MTRRSHSPAAQSAPPGAAEGWMRAQGWAPFDFQRETWAAIAAGKSGLLHATTGAGKTYAVWLGLLQRYGTAAPTDGGPRLLWITPLRALASDTAAALQAPLAVLAPLWRVGVRTGDTSEA